MSVKCMAQAHNQFVALDKCWLTLVVACHSPRYTALLSLLLLQQVLGMFVDCSLKLGGFPSPVDLLAALPFAGTKPHYT